MTSELERLVQGMYDSDMVNRKKWATEDAVRAKRKRKQIRTDDRDEERAISAARGEQYDSEHMLFRDEKGLPGYKGSKAKKGKGGKSVKAKPKPKATCEWCGKSMQKSSIKAHQFDSITACKKRPANAGPALKKTKTGKDE